MESLIHSGKKCRICKKFPIVGIRYKCLQCNSFDLCENCEKKRRSKSWIYFIKIEKQ